MSLLESGEKTSDVAPSVDSDGSADLTMAERDLIRFGISESSP